MFPAQLTMTTRAGRPTLWLDVSYDGTHPPRDLFADLEMIGFVPPTEMPPPSSAMDWSAPDPATGRPYTVRPHEVHATIEPPRGTGTHGSWTEGERTAFAISLAGVLRRHGIVGLEVGMTMPIPDPSNLATLPPPPSPAQDEPGHALAEAEVVGFGLPSRAAASPPTTLASHDTSDGRSETVRVGSASSEGAVTLVEVGALIHPVDHGHLDAALGAAGVEVRTFHRAVREVVNSYRGSTYTSEVPALRLVAMVRPDAVNAVVTLLTRTANLDPKDASQLWVVHPEAPEPMEEVIDEPDGVPEAPAAGGGDGTPSDQARLRLVG